MLILAFDSTASAGSAALVRDTSLICEFNINNGNTHSETLLPTAESILKISGFTVDDVDLFACSQGPGSFTGIRIGAATVKGLAFGKNKPCVGVPSTEALAYNFAGADGVICAAINARRGNCYNALFRWENRKMLRLCEDRIISFENLAGEIAGQNVHLCGDCVDELLRLIKTPDTPELLRPAHAYSVALAAYNHYNEGKFTDDRGLTPDYLRPSQAERERTENLSNK